MKNFNTHDVRRDACQLMRGGQSTRGYDWWWHSFTGYDAETGEAQPFFIEFFVCNPAYGCEEPLLGQLPEHRRDGVRPSYVMVKAGTWGKDAVQLHRFFGWKAATVRLGVPFAVTADNCFVTEGQTYGEIRITPEEAAAHPEWMCGAGEMSWDLTIKKDIAFNVGYGAGPLMRRAQLFEMFWHAEGMKSFFEGEVTFNGRLYRVSPEDCYGYADKNWGKDFTSPWVWLSSNNLVSLRTGRRLENSVFDIGGGCPKVGPVALKRKLLSAFWYEGRPFEFNFAKFWHVVRTRFDCRETDDEIIWHVEQRTWTRRMVTDITCEKADMLLVNYESPDGAKRHNRLWNGGNGRGIVRLYEWGHLVDEVACANVGCEYGEY